MSARDATARAKREPLSVGLLSFAVDTSRPESTLGNEHTVLDVLSARPELDLLVTSGWTLNSGGQLTALRSNSRNDHTVVVLETWKDDRGALNHGGYALRGKTTLVDRTPQVFATSAQVNKSPELLTRLMDEVESPRRFDVAGWRATWLICGEINVLANAQSDGNRVDVRHAEYAGLRTRWQRILDETDIFVNPTHTVMGNQGKLLKRREYLSAGGRVFCSASNVDAAERSADEVRRLLGAKSVQYLFKDCVPQPPEDVVISDRHILRVFTV